MTTLVRCGDAMNLDERPERLTTLIQEMGDRVGDAMDRLVVGFSKQDRESCTALVVDGAELDDLHREARDLCFSRLLSPVSMTADDLRWMISMEQVAAELERMGDHCVSVAKIARELVGLSDVPPTTDLSELVSACARQVRGIVSALASADPHRARFVAFNAPNVDVICRRVVANLNAHRSGAEGALSASRLRLATRHIERVAEHVTNVAEHLVDAATGQIEALV
ncbi:MAG: phosphate uptake regulator, PhoU [Chloroflexi bacterium]|jgi:phosphate transport system protein|nr:phosphate uptake regulator, PhoU [Chloroflexota bacterium]